MKKLSIIFFLIASISASAQILKPAKWTFSASKSTPKAGETIELYFNATIDDKWYMYSSDLKVDGPLPTKAIFTPHDSYALVGKLIPVKPHTKHDDIWGGEVAYFENTAKFIQKVKILKADPIIEGKIECQTCTIESGKCVPNKDKFKFELK